MQQGLVIKLVYTHNFVDFDSLTDPISRGVSIFSMETNLSWTKEIITKMPCLLHQVQFNDELVNPLASSDDASLFISADSQQSFDFNDGHGRELSIQIKAFLSGELHVEQRTRYNFWDLLGDVGGFHDGLILLAEIFLGFAAQLAFESDYLNGRLLDNSGKNFKRVHNSPQFQSLLSSVNEGRRLEKGHAKLLSWFIGQTKQVKQSVIQGC